MTITHILYLTMLTAAFVVSLMARKSPPTMKILSYLLGLSLAVELSVNIIHHGLGISQGYFPLYHFYVFVEFGLLAYFFYKENRLRSVRRTILVLVVIYAISLMPIYLIPLQTLHEHPGITYNMMGILRYSS